MTKKQKERAIKLYQRGLSSRAVGEKVGCSGVTVLNILKRAGLSRRCEGQPRKYTLNESYFDKITTEKQAYWVGFLSADGWVAKNSRGGKVAASLRVGLKESDRGHVEAFAAALGYNGPAHQRKDGIAELAIFSYHLCESLAKHGIVPNKTWKLKGCPATVPAKLKQHFWRGYFDGDGCICNSPRKGKPFWVTSVVGTREMMRDFHRWMSAHVPKLADPLEIKSGVFRVSCGGTGKPKLFIRALYENATVALWRKAQLAAKLLDTQVRRVTAAFAA